MSENTATIETTEELEVAERRELIIRIPLPSKKKVKTIIIAATAVGAVALTVAKLKSLPDDDSNALYLDADVDSTDDNTDPTPDTE